MSESELSRPFQLAELGDGPNAKVARLTIRAEVEECAALAGRFDLLSVDNLEADLSVRLESVDKLVVAGHIRAAVVQRCVATLDPVPATIVEDLEVVFAQGIDTRTDEEAEEDLPEPWPGAVLDLGELVAQQLGLALDPYPRAPGAEVDFGADQGQGANMATHRPFAGLGALRDRLTEKG